MTNSRAKKKMLNHPKSERKSKNENAIHFFCWIELMRSHGYISMTILQEEISELMDVKNPFDVQSILLTAWLDQTFNQNNFWAAMSNLGIVTLRHNRL